MRKFLSLLSALALMASSAGYAAQQSTPDELKQQVTNAEIAFAKTMADRDYSAFSKHIADDAIFFAGKRPIRGGDEVKKAWKSFYEGAAAPFSWAPEIVEVLPSGNLAISSGPVKDPDGKLVATFTSIWRRDADGAWKVIFDKGTNACNCDKP